MASTWIEARPQIHIPDLGLDSRKQEAHIAMAYLGDVDPKDVMDVLVNRHRHWMTRWYIMCQVHGVADWISADGRHYHVALVQPTIPKFQNFDIYTERDAMVVALRAAGIAVNDDYPFVPHITIASGDDSDNDAYPGILRAPVMFIIDRYYVAHKDDDGNTTRAVIANNN